MAKPASFEEAPDLRAAEVRTLPLAQIVADDDLYSRTHLHFQAISTYQELYEDDPTLLPPLDVYQQTKPARYLLADGVLRYHAARKANITALPCRIFTGTARDAFLHAVAMNSRQQGQPYQQQDYQKIVRWFVRDADLSLLSHREMARRIGCSHTLVNRIAKTVAAETMVTQALAVETVSSRAKTPQGQEAQQLAAFLQVPVRVLNRYEAPWAKRSLIREVAQGATLEEAKAAVRCTVQPARGQYGSGSAPATLPSPLAEAPIPAAEPAPPAAVASALGTALADAVLQHLGLDQVRIPALLVEDELVALVSTCVLPALLATPSGLDAPTSADVRQAVSLAVEQMQARLSHMRTALGSWRALMSLADDDATVYEVVAQLTAQRYTRPPATARKIHQLLTRLQTYLAEHAPTSTSHPARREVEL
jgi:ParB-like chromosome segregation protein Spo0J